MKQISEVSVHIIGTLKSQGYKYLLRWVPEIDDNDIPEDEFDTALKYIPFKSQENAVEYTDGEEDAVIFPIDEIKKEMEGGSAFSTFYIEH